METRRITQDGIELVKFFEGFSALSYADPVGIPTIGYGHVVIPGENWTHLTEADGEDLLRKDVAIAEDAVSRLIIIPLADYQFSALVSWTFNLGAGALQGSMLRRRINQGKHDEAPAQMRRWVYAAGSMMPGLVRRREAEAIMYAGQDWRKVINEKGGVTI